MIWTDATTDRLCAMWSDGRSQAAIAGELGTTIGAVSGKIGRMGLVRNGKSYAFRMSLIASQKAAERRKSVKPPQHIPAKKARSSKPVPLLERTGCAYPVTDEKPHRFCNKPSPPDSYCEFHRSIMFRVAS